MSPPSIEEYHIGWVCALPEEMTAARAMLDEEYELCHFEPQDDNTYVLGRLGEHNIAMACLPKGIYGTRSASTVTTNIWRTFPEIRFGLMVGIGGGIPNVEKDIDIRLGDVVVSQPESNHGGVVQYDMGKNLGSGKFELKGCLSPPPTRVLTALSKLKSQHDLHGSRIPEFLADIKELCPDMVRAGYTTPGLKQDVLFCSHSGSGFTSTSCDHCHNGRVQRSPRVNQDPVIHYGVIASGNSLIKNVVERDRLGKELGAKCVEMEAAGVMNDFPCIVIRGICDYADAHKNDAWQNYAATTAAAFAKELLLLVRPRETKFAERARGLMSSPPNTYPVHWMVARAVNTLFTGRDQTLAELEKLIRDAVQRPSRSNPNCVVVTGIGGQGKSELCLQLAHRTRQLFWGIFWIDVSTTSLAENGFRNIATCLGIDGSTWEAGRQILANLKEPWFLVLDNADDPSIDLQQYLPSGGLGVIAITSRNDECQHYSTMKWVDLAGLSVTEAQELLLSTAHVAPQQKQILASDAYTVAELLNSHPLALIQAGSYIACGHCTFKEYPRVYQEQRKQLLEFRPSQAQSRYKDVYATFEASAGILQRSKTTNAHDALTLLPILAMYGPNRVPILLLCRSIWQEAQEWHNYKAGKYELNCVTGWHVSRLPPLIQVNAVAWNPFRLTEALHLLKRFSLLSTDENHGNLSVSMHPLVHAWAKDRLDPVERHNCWITSASMLTVSSLDSAFWIKHERQLQPHLQSVMSWDMAQMFASRSTTSLRRLALWPSSSDFEKMIVRIVLRCAWLLRDMRDDNRVYALMQCLKDHLGLVSVVVKKQWLSVYRLTALNMLNYSKAKEAVLLFEQMVKIRSRTLAEDHPDRLNSQHELAMAYRDNGQVMKAVSLLEQVVKIRSQTLAGDHPNRLVSQHELAMAYRDNGQVEKAVSLLEEVVKIRSQTQAEDHLDRLNSQHELAIAYQDNGQVEKAVSLLEQVVKIRSQTQAEDHPNRLASQHMLATAYQDNGQVEKAVSLLEEVVKIRSRTLAEDHPDRLNSQHELAMAYRDNRQVMKAVSLLEQVVKIRSQTQAEDHPHRLESEHELAVTFWKLGRREAACKMIQHVVATRQVSLREDHPDRRASEEWLRMFDHEMSKSGPSHNP